MLALDNIKLHDERYSEKIMMISFYLYLRKPLLYDVMGLLVTQHSSLFKYEI